MTKLFPKKEKLAKKATLAQDKKIIKIGLLVVECFYLPLMWPENIRKSIEILLNRDIG